MFSSGLEESNVPVGRSAVWTTCTESTSTFTLSGSAAPLEPAICTHWKPLKLYFGANTSGLAAVPVPSET